ncbi:hypothetical protein LSH36_512g02032 [Paralvinella palmiformis]|uniref:Uncharacterized protein n=1 Tax=Paralvinella palmiformis TaxID=53620 RepID=A0AAD9MYY8_9ANNE|nr:hypothetical protein LSH36_512g02032 [Paralvinella palmiformis]
MTSNSLKPPFFGEAKFAQRRSGADRELTESGAVGVVQAQTGALDRSQFAKGVHFGTAKSRVARLIEESTGQGFGGHHQKNILITILKDR